MQSLDEMIKKLPPERRAEVLDFAEFLLAKVGGKDRPKMACDWAGGLEDTHMEYTSVELQHKASQWRTDDEMSR